MSSSKPKSVTLRQYAVGFGDCYLLSFHYGKDDRHVLIDFGTKGLPKDAPKDRMLKLAHQIKKDCGGKLTIVVATHRHQDHISGFATNSSKTGAGNVIASCKPSLVIQPWTEDRDLAATATAPALAASRNFRATLGQMQRFASSVVKSSRTLARSGESWIQELRFKGENGLSNKSAVENLMNMAKNEYVSCGDKLNVESLLPGVKVTVLGPPTLKQAGSLSYAKESPEYWLGVKQAWAAQVGSFGNPRRHGLAHNAPPEARWFIAASDRVHKEEMLELTRELDDVLNNTSLILLFEACGKKLLFPGDAQLENWSYALDKRKKEFEKLLRGTDLYKVGHHGSRNATSRKLWDLFDKRSGKQTKARLQTLMSTKSGTFDKHHEVPRGNLVTELKAKSKLYDSRDIKVADTCQTIQL